ncbi:hypothetical protein N431DRAFT_430566 [Stipitochalara longipes BDJ]|nr:hypothetical protein N431DRAFT_430566 [Stipitochalara longipes BDJ]
MEKRLKGATKQEQVCSWESLQAGCSPSLLLGTAATGNQSSTLCTLLNNDKGKEGHQPFATFELRPEEL